MKRAALLVLPVALVAVGLYAVTLGYGFVWDDRSLILENRFLADWSELGRNLASDFFRRSTDESAIGYWRPVVTVSYMIDRSLHRDAPWGFHLTNVLLHAIASCLVALLAARLGLRAAAASGAGILFAVHPVHVEAVAWVSGRTDLFCAVFTLAALLLEAGGEDERRAGRRVAAVGCTALALLSKEMAAVLPLLVGLRALVVSSGSRGGRWALALRRGLPHAIVVAAYVAVRFGALDIATRTPPAAAAGRVSLFWTWWSGALDYLRVLVWPAGLGIVPTVELEAGPSIRVVAGAFAIGAIGATAYLARRVAPVAAWALGAFLVSLLPLTNFLVPITAPDAIPFPWAERYLYLPSAMACIAAGWLLGNRPRAAGRETAIRKWAWAAFAVVAVAGFARSSMRVADWKDDLHLFGAAVRQAPSSAMAHLGLGVALAESGDLAGGEAEYRRSLSLAPDSPRARFNLGNLLRRRGMLDEAEAEYRRALAVRPGHARAWLNLGLVLLEARRLGESLDAFSRADEALPGYADAKVNRANVLRLLGRSAESVPLYESALAIDPRLVPARLGLAGALLATGVTERGERVLRDLVADHPDLVEARLVLAKHLEVTGRTDEAEAEYREARRLRER